MKTPRICKQFWAVTEAHSVRLVVGWECPNPEMWWVPELGSTMTVGYHLFPSKKTAKAKAITEIAEAKIKLEKELQTLEEI